MQNPWSEISTKSKILPSDKPLIKEFNLRYRFSSKYQIQDKLFPEPFIGDPQAGVYLLNLNPGYKKNCDETWHAKKNFQEAAISNLKHSKPKSQYPFYFLDPRFAESPAAIWWKCRMRHLIEDVGLERIARGIFCIELFPYHTASYKRFPIRISRNGLVPSSDYGTELVRRAIKERKLIVAMRATTQWCEFVKELRSYDRLISLKNPRSVYLTPGNMDCYSHLCRELISGCPSTVSP